MGALAALAGAASSAAGAAGAAGAASAGGAKAAGSALGAIKAKSLSSLTSLSGVTKGVLGAAEPATALSKAGSTTTPTAGGEKGGSGLIKLIQQAQELQAPGGVARKVGGLLGEDNPLGKGLSAFGNSFDPGSGQFDLAALLDPRIRRENELKRQTLEELLAAVERGGGNR